jgi:membrane fusion protein, multidrug efflux system
MGIRAIRWTASARRILEAIVGIAVLGLVLAWLAGAFEHKIPPGTVDTAVRTLPADAVVEEVHEVEQEYVEQAVGTLKAASRSVISAKVMATINSIEVTAGDLVAEGDLLIQLDPQEFEARLRQAESALRAAEATRAEAVQRFDRAEQLLPSRSISQQDYDQARRNLEVSQAEERRAEQAIHEAEVLLSYTTIRAPKLGRVVDRLAEPGDTTRPGEPLLVLYDASSLRLEAPVLEHLAVKLQIGQPMSVYVDALQREIAATIDEIVPQADAPSRSFLVKASLPRSEDLYEGMFGRLRIPAGTRRHLCLAIDALQRVGQLEFVDVLAPDGSLQRRYVKTGRVGIPGRIEVLSGLRAGEQVVVRRGAAAS